MAALNGQTESTARVRNVVPTAQLQKAGPAKTAERILEVEALRRELLVKQGPSTRRMSEDNDLWNRAVDVLGGDPFDATRVSWHSMRQMRRDPMLAFALHFLKMAQVRGNWYVDCPSRPDIAVFMEKAWRRIWGRRVLQIMNSLDFGCSPIVTNNEEIFPDWKWRDPSDMENPEKPVWDYGAIPAVVPKHGLALPPYMCRPAWNTNREFNGIIFDGAVAGFPLISSPADESGNVDHKTFIDVRHSLWYTHEKDQEFGSLWGFPRTAYAYKYWWSYWFNWALSDRAYERKSDPPIIIWHPDDTVVVDEETEEVVSYSDKALQMAEELRSGANIAMPTMLAESMDGSQTNVKMWDFQEMQVGDNLGVFNQRFEYLDVMKLRSMMVPEQAFLEGKGGTSSRNVQSGLEDVFSESQIVLSEQVATHITEYDFPSILHANFPEFEGTCRLVPKGLADDDLNTANQVLQWIGAKNPESLEVDVRTMLEERGIPLKSAEQMKAEREMAIKQAQATLPPEIAGGRGETRVETVPAANEQGFTRQYVKTGEVLNLDDVSSWLPSTEHFADRGVRQEAEDIRAIWRQEYFGRVYEDFARFLEGQGLDLADETPEDKANRILAAWGAGKDLIVGVAEKTAAALHRIVGRGGARELGRAKVDDSIWDLENPDVVNYVRRRGAELVTGVPETVKGELRVFLSNELSQVQSPVEIADKVRAHFAQFPGWKADRLARTEAMMGYNAATLIAAGAAGRQTVQALDAADPANSDEHCIARDGQFFNLEDAWTEQLENTHPNDTLAWRIVMGTPTVDLCDEMPPDVPEGHLAFWDGAVARVSTSLPRHARRQFLLALGDRLNESSHR